MSIETKTTPSVSPQEPQTQNWAVENKKLPKTTGEKIFNGIAYGGFAGVGTFVLSVVAAYLFKFSERAFPGFKRKPDGTSWAEKWKQWGNGIASLPLIRNSKDPQKAGETTLMTTALMMGGNILLFPIRWMEGSKKDIVHYFNEKFGKPGEVEKGDAQVQNEPPQSWGSIIKARITAWLVVFTSLTVAGNIFERIKRDPNDINAMGKFEQKLGNLFVSAAKTVKPDLSERNEFRARKLGELSAIDVFATVAASTLLYVTSKVFARQKAAHKTESAAAHDIPERPLSKQELENDYVPVRSYERKETRTEPARDETETTGYSTTKKPIHKRWQDELLHQRDIEARDKSHASQRQKEKSEAENEPAAATV